MMTGFGFSNLAVAGRMGELRSAQGSNNSSSSSSPANPSSNVPVVDDTPKGLMSRFYALQEERVQTYHMFEEGFQAYLHGSPNYNFPLYQQLVHEITETFNKISADVLAIKARFATQNNLMSIAEIIDKIQDAEKSKLELTAKLQLCRQKQKDQSSETVEAETDDVKQQLKDNRDYLIEQMEELKYESEDLYTAGTDSEPETIDSNSELQPTASESSNTAER